VAQSSPAEQEGQRQQRLNEQRRLELQKQLQQQFETEQQAKQQEAAAALEAQLAKQKADQEQGETNKAAATVGMEKGMWEAAAGNVEKRLQMVKNSVKSWKAPNGYVAKGAAHVSLTDPFAESTRSRLDNDDLQKALTGTCLTADQDHGVARVSAGCAKDGCAILFQIGDYPIDADGSPIDTPARAKTFFQNCKRPTQDFSVLTETGQTEVRRAPH
jgi:hypothetical protein